VGHIGLAAAIWSGRDLVQVEQEQVAAQFAARNATAAGRAGRTDVRLGRMQDVLGADELFPVVIADPPYLQTVEVGEWPDDPVGAIDGGVDGLDLVRVCVRLGAEHLAYGGHLVLQVGGPDQAMQVERELPPSLVLRGVRAFDTRRAVMHLSAAA
jgi:release factor glutamine methyltransferase